MKVFQTFIYQDYSCFDFDQKCADGLQCISKYSLCDGREDCTDRSDEELEVCRRKFLNRFFQFFSSYCKMICIISSF